MIFSTVSGTQKMGASLNSSLEIRGHSLRIIKMVETKAYLRKGLIDKKFQ